MGNVEQHTIKVTATCTYTVTSVDGVFQDYEGTTNIKDVIEMDKESFENGDVFIDEHSPEFFLEVVK